MNTHRFRLTRRQLFGAALAGTLLPARRGWTQSAAADAVARAESRRGELTDLLSELVATPSPVGESAAEAQAIVERYLIDQEFSVQVTSDEPLLYADDPEFMPPGEALSGPAVNVMARPSTRNAAPRFALFAHIDTEFAGDGWVTNPVEPTLQGSRMYGLGTADDKGGVAAMLVAAAALASRGGPAPTVMSLHGKGGGSRGSLPAFRRTRGLDAVLYLHPAETGRGLRDIKHVVQGSLDLILDVEGWRGAPLEIGSPDSARYDEGGDALSACLLAIDSWRQTALRGAEVNVGRIDAGDRIGSVPDRCHAELRVLFEEPRTTDEILATLRAQLDALSETLATPDGRFYFTLSVGRLKTNPASVRWDSPSSRALRDAIASVTDQVPDPHTRHYAGDIRYPIRLSDAPAFGIGSLAGNFYGPNEWVDIDDLVNLVAVTMLTMESWAREL